jgi:hypothetical protein
MENQTDNQFRPDGASWSGIAGTRFWRGAHWSRRIFFRHLASALGGYFLMPRRPGESVARAAVNTRKSAKNVVFVLMSGGPSHIDTFDLKMTASTPREFSPVEHGSIVWPRGIMPRLADQLQNLAVLRSVKAWASVHELSRNWIQINRSPTSGLARIAPHIGSVASLELAQKDAVMPAFVSLNAGTQPGAGYFTSDHAPFMVNPGGGGLGNTRHPDGQPAFDRRLALLGALASEERLTQEFGGNVAAMTAYNAGAQRLMYNSDVDRVFTFAQDERNRYGNTGFGNACIAARNLLRANLGTRFIQITVGGWDNHAGIYTGAFNPSNANSLIRQFDNGLGTLIGDLSQEGLLNDTMVIAMGEFGRTVRGTSGSLNAQAGRDHFLTQSVLMAGGGVRGGTAIGKTDGEGYDIVENGWNRDRWIRPEDIGATIYSALGIDWTTVRRDDPFGRGFEYIPTTDRIEYTPINELFG